jgi:hypothetical protein
LSIPLEPGEWRLVEIRKAGEEPLIINRDKLRQEGYDDLFTLTMAKGSLNGKGAPNYFSAPVTAGANNSITVNDFKNTTDPNFNPEYLVEKEYFGYIARVKSYRTGSGRLEFMTTDDKGKETVLVYTK